MLLLTPAAAGRATVVRLRPRVVPDSYGDPGESWDNPARFPLVGAEVTPPGAVEHKQPTADELENTRRLSSVGALDLKATDRVEVDGDVWQVDGTPVVRRGFALGVYTTAKLRRFVALKSVITNGE